MSNADPIVDNHWPEVLAVAVEQQRVATEVLAEVVGGAVVDGGLSWEQVADATGVLRMAAIRKWSGWVDDRRIWQRITALPEPGSWAEVMSTLRSAGALRALPSRP